MPFLPTFHHLISQGTTRFMSHANAVAHTTISQHLQHLDYFCTSIEDKILEKCIHPITTTLSSYKCLSFPSNHPSIALQYCSSRFFHLPHTFPWNEVCHGGLSLKGMVLPNRIGKKKHVVNSYIGHT